MSLRWVILGVESFRPWRTRRRGGECAENLRILGGQLYAFEPAASATFPTAFAADRIHVSAFEGRYGATHADAGPI